MDSNKDGFKVCGKRVLIYIPSIEGKMAMPAIEGLTQLLWDCWKWREKGWEFVPYFGVRMSLPSCRNQAVQMALEGNFDYILWMDDDMVVPVGTEIFSQLVKHDKDIVAPLFFIRSKPYLPLLFKRVLMANGGFMTYNNILDYEKGLVECDGVGFGMVLIKMEVFKKLKMPYFEYNDQYGEDLRFCENATRAGFKIFCDTNLILGHIANPEVILEEHFKSERAGAELFMQQKEEDCRKKAEEVTPKADLIIPCYKEVEITKNCISSILNNTESVNMNIIIVNDGADKGIRKYAKQLQKHRDNITYLESKKQQGATASTNMGIAAAKSAYIVLCNNDIEIPSNMTNWLFRFIQKLATEQDLGAVGGTSNYIFGLQQFGYNAQFAIPEHYTKVLIPLCMCIKREVIEKVGFLDERYTLPNKIGLNQDLDYCIRIRKAGYKLKIIRDIFIKHEGEHTQSKCGDVKEAEKITRQMLVDKWGEEEVLDTILLPTTQRDKDFLMKGE
jgi:GT2 family glycosyltransferase